MKRRPTLLRRALLLPVAALLLLALSGTATAQAQQVAIDTSKGVIVVELDPQAAPETVENFLQYVRDGFYDGTIFHRVIDGFMIQGGGFTPDLSKKAVRAPVRNESDNGLSNIRGTLAMARTVDPHSATAQFYINLVDNSGNLDARESALGYTVFGRVVEGMAVVDAIAKVATDFQRTGGNVMRDVPVEPVVIEKIRVR